MPRDSKELEGVSLLGNQHTKYNYDYTPEVLETFLNKHPEHDYLVTFDAYEFTSLCLTGDTLIDVARDETKHPEGIPIRDLVGTNGYVFGFNTVDEQVECHKYSNVRKTGSQVPVIKINLKYYSRKLMDWAYTYVRCTPNHPILVKTHWHDYEWVNASDLTEGMHLVYSGCVGDTIKGLSRHRLIASAIEGTSMEELSNFNLDVHHKDHNHYNNSPSNLEIISKHNHYHHHRSTDYGYDDSLDVDELVEMYESGLNISQISQIYHCDFGTIKSRLEGKVEFRTQAESLSLRMKMINKDRDCEICKLYIKGYTSYEIGDYFDLHETRILDILRENGVAIRGANDLRTWRKENLLPPLNHRVVSIEYSGVDDVYNMEVEGIHNFFANNVIVHNCPKTGQPDFAKVVINYIPNERMVESKSLKLYLFSFRSRGDFHEDCINIICNDLIALMDPKYIEVKGCFAPRGGISIFPAVAWANPKFDYEDFKKQRMLDLFRDASKRTVRYDM